MAVVRARYRLYQIGLALVWEPDFDGLENANASDLDCSLAKLMFSYSNQCYWLTFATFASVTASVTTVGCTTLCTVKLNIGSIRRPAPPEAVDKALVPVVPVDAVERLELDRFNVSSLPLSCASVGLSRSVEALRLIILDVATELEVSRDGPFIVATLGDGGIEAPPMDADRNDTFDVPFVPDLARPRDLLTICICRLRGFFDAVGGGLTMMYCYQSATITLHLDSPGTPASCASFRHLSHPAPQSSRCSPSSSVSQNHPYYLSSSRHCPVAPVEMMGWARHSANRQRGRGTSDGACWMMLVVETPETMHQG